MISHNFHGKLGQIFPGFDRVAKNLLLKPMIFLLLVITGFRLHPGFFAVYDNCEKSLLGHSDQLRHLRPHWKHLSRRDRCDNNSDLADKL